MPAALCGGARAAAAVGSYWHARSTPRTDGARNRVTQSCYAAARKLRADLLPPGAKTHQRRDAFRRDATWWILVIGPPILVFSIIGWLLFRDRKRRRAEELTRSSERRRSLELTATFRPGDSAADGAFFSIPLDEEKPQFV